MCGECCGAWNLPVEDPLYNKIRDIDWVDKIIQVTKVDFKTIDEQKYLPKVDGICVFLDKSDNCCLLHKKLGQSNKPLECNRFPFAFARDKRGNIYLDTSFYCKAIVDNKGINVKELITEEYIKDFDVFEISDIVAFSPVLDITLTQSIEIREVINRYLYEKCITLPVDEWATPFINAFSVLLAVEVKIKNKQDCDFESLFRKVESNNLDIKKLLFKQNIFTAFLLRKYRILPDVFTILFNNLKFKEPIIVEEIDLNQYKCITFDENLESKCLLLKYLLDINQRTILLGHGHSVVGIYIAMFVGYCLLNWYMKALAIIEQSNIVEGFHIKLAIKIVERYYIGHNVRFLELFRKPLTFIVLKSFLRC